jgi:hypothetical protein
MEELGAKVWFGPPGATHVWQPCDHHLGREYGRRMGESYDLWMSNEYEAIAEGKVSAANIRVLLTKWAGDAYRALEEEREALEVPWLAGVVGAEPSRFYKAFLRTGCLVTRDGTQDEEIRPHREIKGKVMDDFQSLLVDGWKGGASDSESESVDESDGDADVDLDDYEGWNSEDEDDEEVDIDGDGEQEPIPDGMVLQLPDDLEEEDEEAKIREARACAHKDGDEGQIRDFNLALRIAKQQSVVAAPEFKGARDSDYGARRHKLYDGLVAEHEARMKKPPTKAQVAAMWDQAGNDVLAEGVIEDSSNRRSKRVRRERV